jgi:phosphoribosylaminoimidazolecarboxamide formyltransferase/IMP cyclohydrolase
VAKIERALISVSDKTGVVEFARGLAELGVEILSTGGTARLLREAGLRVVEVSDYTGQPEILGGRVKTLHPKIHAGLLALRDDPSHQEEMSAQGFAPIDLLAVNLYPFERTAARADCSFAEAIENIDIGGPAMIRAAAKNHAFVTVVVDPADYPRILQEMRASGGQVSPATNLELAKKVFRTTARYDGAIADWLGAVRPDGSRVRFGETLHVALEKVQDLRYGENPHQEAAFYREAGFDGSAEPSITSARQLQGKELSFNNIVDAHAALELVKEFEETVAVAIKHTNPCGVAISDRSLADAFRKCRACDPVSIFGGIVGFNREVDLETAEELKEIFLEIVIAPAFRPEARELFGSSKRLQNVRLLEVPLGPGSRPSGLDMKKVTGGMLVQERDLRRTDLRQCRVVTERAPTEEELRALDFAWRVCKHVKSNAIVFAAADRVIGVGAGQMSRVDAARIAVMRARTHGLETRGSVVASDAFFPFRDGLDVCAEAGATAVVQPGGSLRDAEVIQAANERGLAMVFTGIRHFRH